MSDNKEQLPPRSDEKQLNELVWAHHPELKTKPKEMTRGKLAILRRSGYVEYDPGVAAAAALAEDTAADQAAVDPAATPPPAQDESPTETADPGARGTRRAPAPQKEQS